MTLRYEYVFRRIHQIFRLLTRIARHGAIKLLELTRCGSAQKSCVIGQVLGRTQTGSSSGGPTPIPGGGMAAVGTPPSGGPPSGGALVGGAIGCGAAG